MRVIFLGTPDFAVPTLARLIEWPEAEVVAVVTQPDRPAGRGGKLTPPPTKVLARYHDIPVFQPERLSRSEETVEAMRALSPDVLVTVAFGQILKKPVLEMAPLGVVNLHASLLPQYRGAAPINWAIIRGETKTGLTTMLSDVGVDTGAMLLKREVDIAPDATAEDLASLLACIGPDLMVETLRRLQEGSITPEPQDDSLATSAPMLKKEMGLIDWTKPARDIHNQVRGLQPWPAAYTSFQGTPLKLLKTKPLGQAGRGAPPGTVLALEDAVVVACGPDGAEQLGLLEVQPANRARMTARAWANGVRLTPGERLG